MFDDFKMFNIQCSDTLCLGEREGGKRYIFAEWRLNSWSINFMFKFIYVLINMDKSTHCCVVVALVFPQQGYTIQRCRSDVSVQHDIIAQNRHQRYSSQLTTSSVSNLTSEIKRSTICTYSRSKCWCQCVSLRPKFIWTQLKIIIKSQIIYTSRVQ